MISITSTGSFEQTEKSIRRMTSADIFAKLSSYGAKGCASLAAATPVDSNLAASSWTYEVKKTGTSWEIIWSNTDRENGFPVAISLQYGYGTGTGGYVRGRDYINPAIQPIFEQIVADIWREVTRG